MSQRTSRSTVAGQPARRDLANAIRALSMDAVQAANCGHPGMPMGMADIAEVLWNDYLKHNPGNPEWWDRDRFVLSNGHGSMLLYSVLHLSGYPLSMDEIRNFRQFGYRTAGHPERAQELAIETTTGCVIILLFAVIPAKAGIQGFCFFILIDGKVNNTGFPLSRE